MKTKLEQIPADKEATEKIVQLINIRNSERGTFLKKFFSYFYFFLFFLIVFSLNFLVSNLINLVVFFFSYNYQFFSYILTITIQVQNLKIISFFIFFFLVRAFSDRILLDRISPHRASQFS